MRLLRRSSAIKRPCVKVHSVQKINNTVTQCTGGFCEYPKKPRLCIDFFLSNGEGVPPPLKKREEDIAFKLSYPDDDMVQPETYTPLMILWMGRKYYSCS
jgi:hypothetical protein